tara:strand:- start:30 stop:1232 length:1203 start_codon:yes stop_codon:yes gene_type:complete
MSLLYKESNFETTKELYDKSIIYKGKMYEYSQRYSNVVDFNFAEKYLYGRVNRDFVSIRLNEKLVSLSAIRNSADLSNVRVLNFVADGFQELSRQFTKAAQIGKINRNEPYLTNLQAYEGYSNPDLAYSNYLTSFVDSIKIKISEDNINFRDFEDFMHYLKDYVSAVGLTFPITKTAFIKSRHNDYNTNGLTIEISDLSYEDDDQKIEDFVNSPNFEYYLNACNSFGFMVDMTSPWKITLDVGSQDVIDGLMKKYGYSTLDHLLLVGYQQTHLAYYSQFKSQLLSMYNNIANRKFSDIDYCNGEARAIVVTPKTYTNEQFYNIYNEDYFLKLYCMFRIIEEEHKVSNEKAQQIITDFVNLSRSEGILTTLSLFEKFISQPFDYRGSLSYLIRERERREDT